MKYDRWLLTRSALSGLIVTLGLGWWLFFWQHWTVAPSLLVGASVGLLYFGLYAFFESKMEAVLPDLINIIRLRRFSQLVRMRYRPQSAPPQIFRSLLWLFSKPKQRDAVVDDLDELFATNLERFGVRKARWIYRWDAFRSIFAALVGVAAGLAVFRKLFHG